MVEILEKRDLKRYKIECRHCHAILTFADFDESFKYSGEDPLGYRVTDWYIRCLNCNRDTITRSDTGIGFQDFRNLIMVEKQSDENKDIVEVIRCKDCDMHRYSESHNLWCKVFDMIMPEDGFCSLGEKKETR